MTILNKLLKLSNIAMACALLSISCAVDRSSDPFQFLMAFHPVVTKADFGFNLSKGEQAAMGNPDGTIYSFKVSPQSVRKKLKETLLGRAGWKVGEHMKDQISFRNEGQGVSCVFGEGSPGIASRNPPPAGVTCYVIVIQRSKHLSRGGATNPASRRTETVSVSQYGNILEV